VAVEGREEVVVVLVLVIAPALQLLLLVEFATVQVIVPEWPEGMVEK
jgi:hypothetical protein